MKTKILLVIFAVLVVSIVGCITIHANYNQASTATPIADSETEDNVSATGRTVVENPKDYTDYHGIINFINPDASKEISLTERSRASTVLTYLHSTTYGGKDVLTNVYVDEKDNQYSFDSKGTQIGYFKEPSYYDTLPKFTGEDTLTGKWISVEAAQKIALSYISNTYGDVVNELTLHEKKLTDEAIYDFDFRIYIGEDNSVTAVRCLVGVLYDGTVVSSSIRGYDAYKSLNTAKSKIITTEALTDYATENAKIIYADDYRGIEIRNIRLMLIDSESVVKIVTIVDYLNELGTVGGSSEIFYYPIS